VRIRPIMKWRRRLFLSIEGACRLLFLATGISAQASLWQRVFARPTEACRGDIRAESMGESTGAVV
jgi:hypothetical protein